MVAGAANNQLATNADDDHLYARGILYAPDYVVNAGGIINVAAEYLGQDQREVFDRVGRIPARLSAVLERAQADKQPPSRVADAMARELIEAAVPLVRSRDVRAGASDL